MNFVGLHKYKKFYFISLTNTFCHTVVFSTQKRLLTHQQMLENQLKFNYV